MSECKNCNKQIEELKERTDLLELQVRYNSQELLTQAIHFRTKYLQAIAAIWAGELNIKKRTLTIGGHPYCLSENYALTVYSNISNTPDLEQDESELLWKQLKYIPPYDFDLIFSFDPKRTPEWDLPNTLGWRGGIDNITLYIPMVPTKDELGDLTLTEVYTLYYQENNGLFRVNSQPFLDLFKILQHEIHPIKTSPLDRTTEKVSSQSSSSQVDLGMDISQEYDFGGVMLRSVGLVWKELWEAMYGKCGTEKHEEVINAIKYKNVNCLVECLDEGSFTVDLVSTGVGTPVLTGPTSGKAIQALASWFLFNYPWNINLTVEFDTTAELTDVDSDKPLWEKLSPSQLTLAVPKKPVENSDPESLIAMSGYNQTGPAYPFTCA